ncbi:cytochrome C [Candidatus Synechococcus calcipolaris G9]|uniref:Cytochrome C n=1 Tax=Candidatus Synechococcus calcipolaris G9 TaxID=1497997 RepID=A0ABT6EWZ7_9SYNE|nr:cytochrome C [Candidatus Synechococcus calcipolaris]MDG2990004.1 cytochrome C [Candidatus Synechococcus calcipolaris G9]
MARLGLKWLGTKGRSLWGTFLTLILLCSGVGWGLAGLTASPNFSGTVDVLPINAQLGAELYLKHCGGCHIGVPPETLPTESWRILIQDTNHYGARLEPIPRIELTPVWNYLRTYSRELRPGEQTPFRVGRSRFFRILHPRVDLPDPINLGGCVSCHPQAAAYNFRQLTPEWQESP